MSEELSDDSIDDSDDGTPWKVGQQAPQPPQPPIPPAHFFAQQPPAPLSSQQGTDQSEQRHPSAQHPAPLIGGMPAQQSHPHSPAQQGHLSTQQAQGCKQPQGHPQFQRHPSAQQQQPLSQGHQGEGQPLIEQARQGQSEQRQSQQGQGQAGPAERGALGWKWGGADMDRQILETVLAHGEGPDTFARLAHCFGAGQQPAGGQAGAGQVQCTPQALQAHYLGLRAEVMARLRG